MLAAEPARAIVVNDQEAAAVGGIANYYDQNNQFPNVGSLNSGCTGSLINSRTVLTAAHCLYNSTTGQPITNLTGVSFVPDPNAIGDPGRAVSSFKGVLAFRIDTAASGGFPVTNDIAVISLAQPVTDIASVKLLTLQRGQPGFPTAGTTITMVGYGLQGTGSSQPAAYLFLFARIVKSAPP